MSPLFSATNTLPSGENLTTVGRTSPEKTVDSWKLGGKVAAWRGTPASNATPASTSFARKCMPYPTLGSGRAAIRGAILTRPPVRCQAISCGSRSLVEPDPLQHHLERDAPPARDPDRLAVLVGHAEPAVGGG